MKKIFALLIAFTLILMLFGCTEQVDEVNENEDNNNEEIEIDSTVSEEIDYTVIDEDETMDVGEMI